jgi:hypothetical protein
MSSPRARGLGFEILWMLFASLCLFR